MSRESSARWPALLLLLALSMAACYSAWQFRVETSIARLLPPAEERLSQLARRVVDSTASRSMALSIGPAPAMIGDREVRQRLESNARQVARQLASDLAMDPGIEWVRRGPDPDFERSVYELYFPRRFNFIEDDLERLAHELGTAGVQARIEKLERDLAGPSGSLAARLAPRDPLQWFARQLERLDATRPADLRVVDGQFVAGDGHALVFLGLQHSAFDGTAQRPLLDRITDLFERHAGDHPGLQLERSGINVFSVDSEARIRADISRVALLSTLGLFILFIVMFRSLRSILLLCLPLVGGFIGAVTACLLCFGEIHGLTLAFGASLLGVCIDYPVHLLNHRGFSQTIPRGVHTGLMLGALTTVVGISALAFSGFEVMQQVAVFAGFGLSTALAVTLVLVPLFADAGSLDLRRRLANGLADALTRLQGRRLLLCALGLLPVLIGVVGLAGARWATSLEGLAPLNPELRREDGRVRQRMGAPGTNEIVIAVGGSPAQALERNDLAFGELSRLADEGALDRFQSLHPVVWAPKLQAKNAAAARDPRVSAAVSAALVEHDFNLEMFRPFFQDQRTSHATPLTLDALRRSALGSLVERFVVDSDAQVAVLSYPHGVKDTTRLRERLAKLEGVHYIDQRQLLDTAYSGLRNKVQSLMLAAGLLMSVLILIRFRHWRPTLATLGPALAAPIVALGGLALTGQELNLFHLLAALVVLSMAMDYGIFLSETVNEEVSMAPATKATLLSISLAAATTCLSFGLLGFSQIPVLMAIGQTIALGILAALALTPSAWLLHHGTSRTRQ